MKEGDTSNLEYNTVSDFVAAAKMEGISAGERQGLIRGVLAVSKNLLRIGVPIEDISRATGLTPAQILQLGGVQA